MSDLRIFTIYAHPRDYEIGYLVREWAVGTGGAILTGRNFRAPSLQAARAIVPPGLFRIARDTEDDSGIMETWV